MSTSPDDTGLSPSFSAAKDAAYSPRLLSLDALRGFDMFWIVGAEDIVHALHKVSHAPLVNLLTQQLTHKDWDGVAFYDLIFPLFVFIVGMSLVFSLSRTITQHGRAVAYQRVITRGLLLWALGIFYYGGLSKGLDQVRLLGVLQRIGLAYLFAGLLFCTFRLRGLIIATVSILVGYWALMSFVPVPDVGMGNFAEGKNLANYVDKMYLPFRKWDGDHDPEGLLSTLPAIGTCLLGVLAGLLMKNRSLDERRKVQWLVVAGFAGIALGFIWGIQFLVIKKLWTSSYVLVAAGFACLFFAAFHQIIEVWNFRKWATPFLWIGLNPLTIYLAHNLLDLPQLANRLVGGPINESFGAYGPVLITTTILGITFWLAHFLYKRKIFLRL
ncbi:MAG: DUF1624 domain-containing protein [Pedosphaera sp.]|nr:DUF1624 domain-containing protein [Pedosphaera sp.]